LLFIIYQNFGSEIVFKGGTALSKCYGLNRFSEDLDFSLLEKNKNFDLAYYFEFVIEEFRSLGMEVSIHRHTKSNSSTIDSAFLKSDTLWGELMFENSVTPIPISSKPRIKIKVEVDVEPPLKFETENQLLIRPFSFYVTCFTLPNLFAGKMHALIYRRWKSRVKGRDWYDLEWYIKNGVPLNLEHFCERAKESGDWQEDSMQPFQLVELLISKITDTSIEVAKEDILRFISNPKVLDIWSKDYFLMLIKKLKIQ
jgi:predicted nucleotidyltransferase component of viral defense system